MQIVTGTRRPGEHVKKSRCNTPAFTLPLFVAVCTGAPKLWHHFKFVDGSMAYSPPEGQRRLGLPQWSDAMRERVAASIVWGGHLSETPEPLRRTAQNSVNSHPSESFKPVQNAHLPSREAQKHQNKHVLPSRPKLLPTDFFVLGNYLGLGNGLPCRKNSCPELFGSVTGIKSVII